MMPWLIQAYFAINALLCATVAVRTVLDPDSVSAATGFAFLSSAGRSESLTVYAGLMLALAAIFTIVTIEPDAHRFGLKIAIALYVPILLFRLVPPIVAGRRYMFAVGPTIVEAVLLIGAMALLLSSALPTGKAQRR